MSKRELLEEEHKRLTDLTSRQSTSFWRPKVGENVIRILPHWSGDPNRVFFKKVLKHFGVGEDRNHVVCRKMLGADANCPICNFVEQLRRSGRKEDKELARDLSAKERFAMNILDINELDKGVQVWDVGITMFNTLLVLFLDEEYGEIDDLKTGRHIKVNRTGEGRFDTRYSIRPAAHPSAVDPAVMNQAINLDEFEPYQVPSEGEMKAMLEGEDFVEEEEEPEDEIGDDSEWNAETVEETGVITIPSVSRKSRIEQLKREAER